MLTDIELGYRLKQRASRLMQQAFLAYTDALVVHDSEQQRATRQQFEIYRLDFQAIQAWLDVKVICALLQEYHQHAIVLSYDEVSRQWRIMES